MTLHLLQYRLVQCPLEATSGRLTWHVTMGCATPWNTESLESCRPVDHRVTRVMPARGSPSQSSHAGPCITESLESCRPVDHRVTRVTPLRGSPSHSSYAGPWITESLESRRPVTYWWLRSPRAACDYARQWCGGLHANRIVIIIVFVYWRVTESLSTRTEGGEQRYTVRKATSNITELRNCVKVEVAAVPGSLSPLQSLGSLWR